MIRLEGVAARQRPLALASVNAEWGAGVHAVLGTRADGGPLLLALIAGAARLRAGTLRVLGRESTDPDVRRKLARVPAEPSLPDALRVGEALAMASAIRREAAQPAAARLATLGVEALETRVVGSLSRAEARAVALVEALTSTIVRVVLIEEPLVGVDPRASSRLGALLRARAGAGCAVVVETASPRDVGELADDCVVLRRGSIAGRPLSAVEVESCRTDGARIRIVARADDDARSIGAALAGQSEVVAVERQGPAVSARGANATELARAAERAIVSSGCDVTEIRLDPPALDDVRALATASTSQPLGSGGRP